MKNMNQLVAGVKSGKEKSEKTKEYQRASEWPKCFIAGCPLPTTIKAENCTCAYHHRQYGFEAECTTEAIKEHLPYLKKYAEMIRWNVRIWREREAQIMGWNVLPATKEEMERPTMYLNRLIAFIGDSIKKRAEELYNNSI